MHLLSGGIEVGGQRKKRRSTSLWCTDLGRPRDVTRAKRALVLDILAFI